jgi:hypothetical protein
VGINRKKAAIRIDNQKTLSNATTKNAKGNSMQIADFQYKILVVCRALVAVTKG